MNKIARFRGNVTIFFTLVIWRGFVDIVWVVRTLAEGCRRGLGILGQREVGVIDRVAGLIVVFLGGLIEPGRTGIGIDVLTACVTRRLANIDSGIRRRCRPPLRHTCLWVLRAVVRRIQRLLGPELSNSMFDARRRAGQAYTLDHAVGQNLGRLIDARRFRRWLRRRWQQSVIRCHLFAAA
ncbi:hypothetical protein [Mycolicibacterium mageritense]|uniref:hypothetical protein n=1 Tax=Mycolicibacterium mageritense TaxID=53462 RepID=UPI00257333FF|nr:hypothetical protein [Mycolicibacterium mageritense]